MKNIILASKSPRRKELLERLNISFDIKISRVDEDSFKQDSPWEFVEKLAYEKANSVSKLVDEDSLVIGCDTVVVFENEILGKPKNIGQAADYLKKLSGNKHLVYSGIAILDVGSNKKYISHEVTEVYMKDLNEEEIAYYINTGEPLDKAGAYGIQGVGAIFIEKINGDYYNVMGLPLNKLYKGLNKLGVNYFEIVK
ncbi:Maf-like protein [Vallitalea sediminicola]